MQKFQAAENLAHFLMEKRGSVLARWQGHMRAAEQRSLFGQFLGKGQIVIDGSSEQLQHIVSRCFGLDYEVTYAANWSVL